LPKEEVSALLKIVFMGIEFMQYWLYSGVITDF